MTQSLARARSRADLVNERALSIVFDSHFWPHFSAHSTRKRAVPTPSNCSRPSRSASPRLAFALPERRARGTMAASTREFRAESGANDRKRCSEAASMAAAACRRCGGDRARRIQRARRGARALEERRAFRRRRRRRRNRRRSNAAAGRLAGRAGRRSQSRRRDANATAYEATGDKM